jgi:hypothetical protein
VTLVAVGQEFALLDGRDARLFILNAAGARVWADLGHGGAVAREHREFVAELRREGLLQEAPCPASAAEVPAAGHDAPAILAKAPLQVAANNSVDPFSGTGW